LLTLGGNHTCGLVALVVPPLVGFIQSFQPNHSNLFFNLLNSICYGNPFSFIRFLFDSWLGPINRHQVIDPQGGQA
jgi:hypothetical protein